MLIFMFNIPLRFVTIGQVWVSIKYDYRSIMTIGQVFAGVKRNRHDTFDILAKGWCGNRLPAGNAKNIRNAESRPMASTIWILGYDNEGEPVKKCGLRNT